MLRPSAYCGMYCRGGGQHGQDTRVSDELFGGDGMFIGQGFLDQ